MPISIPAQRLQASRIRTGISVLCGLACLWTGCALPPDVATSPEPGPPPAYVRDATLSGKTAIDSEWLETARKAADQAGVILLEGGDDALLARIHLIRAARESIDIQTFIWVYDHCGAWIYRELLEAARRGVKVRILVDQFVPPGISAEEYAGLATAHRNLEIRLFRPLAVNAINNEWTVTRNTFTRFTSLNRRMHNKVMLVDERLAIVGGRNIQDAYFDRDPELNFRDRDVVVSGPVCSSIGKEFEIFWNDEESFEASRMRDLRGALKTGAASLPHSLTTPLPAFFEEVDCLAAAADPASMRPGLVFHPVEAVIFLSDRPDDLRRPLKAKDNPFLPLMEALHSAKGEILLQTPYAVIGPRSAKLARAIRKENPHIRIRASTNSLSSADHVYVGGVALKQRRMQITELGIELYLAKPVPGDVRQLVPRYDQLLQESATYSDPNWEADPEIIALDMEGPRFCIHAKSVLIDRETAFVGSHNFDPRSFNLNTECGVLIRDSAFSEILAEQLERAMHPRNSWVVAPRRYPPVMKEVNSLVSFVSSRLPLFDLWPLEEVTCYELREDGKVCQPGDDEFHEHYRDVGPVPGLDIGVDEVQARLVRAFAGMAAPLM